MARCAHVNDRYGQCIFEEGHPPIDNGVGVLYDHNYTMHDRWGNLDVREGRRKNQGYNETPTNEGTEMIEKIEEIQAALRIAQMNRFVNSNKNINAFLEDPDEAMLDNAMHLLAEVKEEAIKKDRRKTPRN